MIRYWSVSKRVDPTVRHLYFGTKMVEGEKVACGVRMQPQWRYGCSDDLVALPICKGCMRAGARGGTAILVHRVRHALRAGAARRAATLRRNKSEAQRASV